MSIDKRKLCALCAALLLILLAGLFAGCAQGREITSLEDLKAPGAKIGVITGSNFPEHVLHSQACKRKS